ncbi:unnamed protein product [Lactuca saligna]|uniref:Uncharacterized protein n=1 Tax=Lactuca saligna TaxID=75948 RepID=A0AA36EIH3_LACSI|nr:unnamed protein product [Lactuca saligna]
MVLFAELQFNLEEENILDELLMSGKQLKILNSKMNYILQFLVDIGCMNSVSIVEVKYLLKSQESRPKIFIENVDKRHEERMATQSINFDHEISKLFHVAKEHHELFMKQVSDMKASLEL